MKKINLNNLEGVPQVFIEELKCFKSDYLDSYSSRSIYDENLSFRALIDNIGFYCYDNLLTAFHYTRAIKKDIENYGLLSRNGVEIQEKFLSRFGHEFSNSEVISMKSCWADYDYGQKQRDFRVYFNYTVVAFPGNNVGASNLLEHYGGEQIYSKLINNSSISNKLKKMGEPLIIKFFINPKNIENFCKKDVGIIVADRVRRLYNYEANFNSWDVDGYTNQNINSKDLEIISFDRNTDYSFL